MLSVGIYQFYASLCLDTYPKGIIAKKKIDKKHQDKEQTVLIIDNRTAAFDVPDYRAAAELLQPFLDTAPFPEIWFYTGYCSDDDGNRVEFSFGPLKITSEQEPILEEMASRSNFDDGRVVW